MENPLWRPLMGKSRKKKKRRRDKRNLKVGEISKKVQESRLNMRMY